MTYQAIINGARGLVYFGGNLPTTLNERDAKLGWNWTFWERVLEGLLAEVRAGSPLHPALLRPETTVRLPTSDEHLEAISRRAGARDLWVIAAHHGRTARARTIRGLPSWASAGTLYPSGKPVQAKDGRITQQFPAWGVRVIRFTRP